MLTLLSKQLAKDGIYRVHWCPGCSAVHYIAVDAPQANGHRWTFNGDLKSPTFSPSINIGPGRCHYHIKRGQIIYTPDTQHALAGKTLPLPPFPEGTWPEAGEDVDEEKAA